jgi:hypothetical protein
MSINVNGLTKLPFRVLSGDGNEVAGTETLKAAEAYIRTEAPNGTYHIIKVIRAFLNVETVTKRQVGGGEPTTSRTRTRPATFDPDAGSV